MTPSACLEWLNSDGLNIESRLRAEFDVAAGVPAGLVCSTVWCHYIVGTKREAVIRLDDYDDVAAVTSILVCSARSMGQSKGKAILAAARRTSDPIVYLQSWPLELRFSCERNALWLSERGDPGSANTLALV